MRKLFVTLMACRVLYQGTVDGNWFKLVSCKTETNQVCSVLVQASGVRVSCG